MLELVVIVRKQTRPRKLSLEKILHVGEQIFASDEATQLLGGLYLVLDEIAVGDQLGGFLFQQRLLPAHSLDSKTGAVDAFLFLLRCELVRQQLVAQRADLGAQHRLHAAERLAENVEALQQSVVDPFINRVRVDEIPDQDLLGFLSDPVDTTNPLFDPGGVPGQVVVYDQAGELEVHTLGCDL